MDLYFDVGLANFLLKRFNLVPGDELFGRAFEHWVFQELKAYKDYSGKDYGLSYWRTTSDFEVDFILGKHEVALEVKAKTHVPAHDFKGLSMFSEEYKVKKSILVSLEKEPRKVGNISVLPWKMFMEQLWAGEII